MGLLTSIGSAECDRGDVRAGIRFYDIARGIGERLSILETPDGALLLTNLAAAKRACGDLDGAIEAFAKARSIREAKGEGRVSCLSVRMPEELGGDFLNRIAIVKANAKSVDSVLKAYGAARLRRKQKKRDKELKTILHPPERELEKQLER